jgi:uncharacterized membrane protein YkvI
MWKTLQIAFAYIGTVVGAGFATGQEIVQFFTQFGWIATITISICSLLFMYGGARLMLIASRLEAKSYEDVNIYLFGARLGKFISVFTLLVLLSVTGVMLAGAGAIFDEHLRLPYQLGLFLTLILVYFSLKKGMSAILSINSLVVPFMILFSLIMIDITIDAPLSNRWLHLTSDHAIHITWLSPILYVSFNLWMAQAVLVPIGASIKKRRTIIWGSVLGGAGIGLLIWVAHFSLSPLMPGIRQFEIPMTQVIAHHSFFVHSLFLLILFSEIFTTLLANVYGLRLQMQTYLKWRVDFITLLILVICYAVSQFGFKDLLSVLYPLFGLIGLFWFVRLLWVRTE